MQHQETVPFENLFAFGCSLNFASEMHSPTQTSPVNNWICDFFLTNAASTKWADF